jgi:hypothetical protein
LGQRTRRDQTSRVDVHQAVHRRLDRLPWVLGGQLHDHGLDTIGYRLSPRSGVRVGPVAANHAAMQPTSVSGLKRNTDQRRRGRHRLKRRQPRPIAGLKTWTVVLRPNDLHLVAQHHDLNLLGVA